jgi:hypothetical protein
MNCHPHCAACCIAPTISSALPNAPKGKPAGQACVNLGSDLKCQVYELRPAVCRAFNHCTDTCGSSHEQALTLIGELERLTSDPAG